MPRVILHSDLNNYFASVECMLNPELRGFPVAVCGSKEERHGIVLAKNMPAKAAGVKTGEAIWQAQQKCRGLVIVPPHFDMYLKYSRIVREIYCRYTDLVEPFGIDECWLDVGGSSRLFGSGADIAESIRRTVKEETGLTVSIGVSFNKSFAKLGSDIKKPDAITCIPEATFKDIVWPLSVSDMMGVGHATGAVLTRCGIYTIGDLAVCPKRLISSRFGVNGELLWEHANGIDYAAVSPYFQSELPKSIGRGTTCSRDLINNEEVKLVIMVLAQQVASGLRENRLVASGIRLSVKDCNLCTVDYNCPTAIPTHSWTRLWQQALSMFEDRYGWPFPVRALTVTATRLSRDSDPQQLSLFCDDTLADRRINHMEDAVDLIRSRYGASAILPASTMLQTAVAPAAHLKSSAPLPLAQHDRVRGDASAWLFRGDR